MDDKPPTSKALIATCIAGLAVTLVCSGIFMSRKMKVFSRPETATAKGAPAAASRIGAWSEKERFKAFLTDPGQLTDAEYRQVAIELDAYRLRDRKDWEQYRKSLTAEADSRDARAKWENSVEEARNQITRLRQDPNSRDSAELIAGAERQLEALQADAPLDSRSNAIH